MSEQQVVPTSLDNAGQIKQKITELQERLQTAAPGYENLLQVIHVALHKDEEVVHLLSDEEIGTVVAGLAKKKGVIIIETARGGQGKTTKGKSLKNISLSEL